MLCYSPCTVYWLLLLGLISRLIYSIWLLGLGLGLAPDGFSFHKPLSVSVLVLSSVLSTQPVEPGSVSCHRAVAPATLPGKNSPALWRGGPSPVSHCKYCALIIRLQCGVQPDSYLCVLAIDFPPPSVCLERLCHFCGVSTLADWINKRGQSWGVHLLTFIQAFTLVPWHFLAKNGVARLN